MSTPPAILDAYVTQAPSAQNAIDIFAGEWASALPEQLGVRAGAATLFDDARMSWLLDVVGGVSGRAVLELGPLEGGHTYSLVQAGAAVTAVEANTRAYLKCLVAKELLAMDNARFLLGDFIEYLRGDPGHFDVCVASGVLYHMRDPAELLALIARVADRVMLWTHYYDEDRAGRDPVFAAKFGGAAAAELGGFSYTLHRYEYPDEALAANGFCGGSAAYAHWLSRADLVALIEQLGWRIDEIAFDHPDHPNGPALALVASRAASA